MPTWMKRVRATLGMGLLWAAGGMGVGGVIELLDNVLPGGLAMASRVDMWPQTLAIPGFIGGVLFAVVLMIAARVQRFDELSMPRFAAWGAVAGLALGVIAMAIGAPVMFLGIMSLAGTVAGAGSLLIARRASSPAALPRADDDAPELRP
jgi:hypothetical protein